MGNSLQVRPPTSTSLTASPSAVSSRLTEVISAFVCSSLPTLTMIPPPTSGPDAPSPTLPTNAAPGRVRIVLTIFVASSTITFCSSGPGAWLTIAAVSASCSLLIICRTSGSASSFSVWLVLAAFGSAVPAQVKYHRHSSGATFDSSGSSAVGGMPNGNAWPPSPKPPSPMAITITNSIGPGKNMAHLSPMIKKCGFLNDTVVAIPRGGAWRPQHNTFTSRSATYRTGCAWPDSLAIGE